MSSNRRSSNSSTSLMQSMGWNEIDPEAFRAMMLANRNQAQQMFNLTRTAAEKRIRDYAKKEYKSDTNEFKLLNAFAAAALYGKDGIEKLFDTTPINGLLSESVFFANKREELAAQVDNGNFGPGEFTAVFTLNIKTLLAAMTHHQTLTAVCREQITLSSTSSQSSSSSAGSLSSTPAPSSSSTASSSSSSSMSSAPVSPRR